MTENITACQTEPESRIEFLKRQQQEARDAIAETEKKMAELVKAEQEAREGIIAAIAEMSSCQPVLDVVAKLIDSLQVQLARLKNKLNSPPGQ